MFVNWDILAYALIAGHGHARYNCGFSCGKVDLYAIKGLLLGTDFGPCSWFLPLLVGGSFGGPL